ncbi:MAG: hypothetical protein HY882_13470 [Deltaproteobacteria bacterium]|nr:hypothetical protein [Deltaproteobacteria bacterium]
MIRQRLREEKSGLGNVLRPVAEVILEGDSFAIEMPMYIDSGADISMIPFRFGRGNVSQSLQHGKEFNIYEKYRYPFYHVYKKNSYYFIIQHIFHFL